jgi:hypothetical protein
VGEERGARSPLIDAGEMVGAVLRTQTGVKPVFVSVDTASTWIRLAGSPCGWRLVTGCRGRPGRLTAPAVLRL